MVPLVAALNLLDHVAVIRQFIDPAYSPFESPMHRAILPSMIADAVAFTFGAVVFAEGLRGRSPIVQVPASAFLLLLLTYCATKFDRFASFHAMEVFDLWYTGTVRYVLTAANLSFHAVVLAWFYIRVGQRRSTGSLGGA